jgi:hypothetical protein
MRLGWLARAAFDFGGGQVFAADQHGSARIWVRRRFLIDVRFLFTYTLADEERPEHLLPLRNWGTRKNRFELRFPNRIHKPSG